MEVQEYFAFLRKEGKEYKIISALNGFIREDMMPNPFEFISDNELIVALFTYLIGGLILHVISFAMCGIFMIGEVALH